MCRERNDEEVRIYRQSRNAKIELFSKGVASLALLIVFGLCLVVVRYPLGVGDPQFNWIALLLIVPSALLGYWPVFKLAERWAINRWYP